VKQFKDIRLHITRYISGNPLRVNKTYISLKEGFPTRFLALKSFIDRNREDVSAMRAVMTLICFTRAVDPTKKEAKKLAPDFSSITDEYKGRSYTIPVKFIREFISFYKFERIYDCDIQKEAYFSMKSSPFGIAILSSWYSLLGLSYSLLNSLFVLSNDSKVLTDLYNFC